jgi:hypothetical protein
VAAGCAGMSEHGTHLNGLPADEAWLHDWALEGIAALERHLAKHAAFAAFVARRDTDSGDGDGAART